MKRKIIVVVLLNLLFLFGCSSGEKKEIINDAPKTEQVEQKEEKKEVPVANIEEEVLVDQNQIRITAKSLEENWLGQEMKVLIENDSEKAVTVSLDALMINDYMMSSFLYETVSAGKKSNATFEVFNSKLKDAGIENIGKIEMIFNFTNPDTYRTEYTSEIIELKTNLYDSMDDKPNDMGKELVNNNGIRIVGKYVDEGSIWGNGVVLYIENNSDRNVYVSAEELSVNGYMIDEYLFSDVRAHKKAIETMILSSSDLENNDIETIEEISTKFTIIDKDSYRQIFTTEEISFSVN